MRVRKKILSIFIANYSSVTLYFSPSTGKPWLTSHFRSQATGIPAVPRNAILVSRSGKVRNRVGNFLRSGRFAKSRELPAERRKLEERRNMYRPRASPLSFIPEAQLRSFLATALLLLTFNFDIPRVFTRAIRAPRHLKRSRFSMSAMVDAANFKYYDCICIN